MEQQFDLEYAGLRKGSLDGKVAVVTGGARNIGRGFARGIAWAGAKVVVTDILEDDGHETARLINSECGTDAAIYVKCDLTKQEDVKNMAKAAFDKYGKVDILVNNAMNMSLNGSVLTSSTSDLEQSFAISAMGVMYSIQEFVPGMIERGYGVVTYSTTQFHYAPPLVGGAIYTAGKAAATSLIMSLANEVKDTGVSVFCMAPTGIFTPKKDAAPPPLRSSGERSKVLTGFDGPIPAIAGGAAMVYNILNAKKLHGSGIILFDAFDAMDYPYPSPETRRPSGQFKRLTDMELTMVLCNMGQGYGEIDAK